MDKINTFPMFSFSHIVISGFLIFLYSTFMAREERKMTKISVTFTDSLIPISFLHENC